VTKPDDSEFFVAFFSQEKKRLTLVHLPQSIELTLGARLRSLFERKVSSVEVHDESFRVFEIRRKPNSNGSFHLPFDKILILQWNPVPEVDPNIFFVEVLRILNQLGCHLDAAIPFSRRGTLLESATTASFLFSRGLLQAIHRTFCYLHMLLVLSGMLDYT
jgi:hypothetical protein